MMVSPHNNPRQHGRRSHHGLLDPRCTYFHDVAQNHHCYNGATGLVRVSVQLVYSRLVGLPAVINKRGLPIEYLRTNELSEFLSFDLLSLQQTSGENQAPGGESTTSGSSVSSPKVPPSRQMRRTLPFSREQERHFGKARKGHMNDSIRGRRSTSGRSSMWDGHPTHHSHLQSDSVGNETLKLSRQESKNGNGGNVNHRQSRPNSQTKVPSDPLKNSSTEQTGVPWTSEEKNFGRHSRSNL